MQMRACKLFGAVLLGIATALALRVEAADTSRPAVDLTTTDGAAAVDGTWRYADVQVCRPATGAPDANGQPNGATSQPHVGL